jgi:hypothetical protein
MSNRFRSTVRAVEAGASLPPLSAREETRRAPVEGDPAVLDRRSGVDRRSARHRGLVERAEVAWRGKKTLVRVVNVSRGGATVEAPIAVQPGDTVSLALPGEAPLPATVRWSRGGRVGLDLTRP